MCFVIVAAMLVWAIGASVVEARAAEVSDELKSAIVAKCDNVKENLVTLQHNDSRTRVYLGRKYEEILMNYVTPLNVALVGKSLSTIGFIDNQNNLVATRDNFVVDYIEYQKGLEELVNMDCKKEPGKFYDKLVIVRAKRKIVADDVMKMRRLTMENGELVKELKEEL